jgi:nicotinamidase-related amidase
MRLNNNYTIVVVDMLYDFIDGALACQGAETAVQNAVKFIEENPDCSVIYVLDHHPANHSSFVEYGGIWPVHCVAGTRGGDIHESFYTLSKGAPSEDNSYFKGCDAAVEQYSGFEAVNGAGVKIMDALSDNVVVCGIATEYCVKATCLDILSAGHSVELVESALAYVDYNGHKETLIELQNRGVQLI